MADIREQIASNQILSAADARLAQLSGMLSIAPSGQVGLNDGTIYPPDEPGGAVPPPVPAPPSRMFAMAPPIGPKTLNCLVLLVDFSDNQGVQTPSHYDRLLFDPANPGSMHSFYKDLSDNNLSLTGVVTGWIRASQPYSYYANQRSGMGMSFPQNTPGLLQEVLQKYISTGGSLANFDRNGDGYVDGLFLVHAGVGAETDPDKVTRLAKIWSHKWTLPSTFSNNGVKAYAYFTAPEDGLLGVFSHEFGHFLGLPDLYDTSYRSQGIGDWCLMAGGSWNGGGNTPARMSAWCLSTLGWVSPRNITGPTSVSLKPLETNKADCCRLWTGGTASKEYFLIENRQQTGRDAALPGSGLAVWHIDERQSDNTNPLAYKVALVQADGRRDLEFARNQGDDADIFPGSQGVTAVTDLTAGDPHTRSNAGQPTGVEITDISVANGVVNAHLKV
jgi:immune inhibitor A